MAQATQISWTDLSWNPVHGCSKVSPGCARCYAETLSRRYRQTPSAWTPANAGENVILKPHKLREPLSGAKAWQGLGDAARAAGKTEGKLVFVNSMSDLFHEQVPDEFIAEVFAVMILARPHVFQILTKRAERQRELLSDHEFWMEVTHALAKHAGQPVVLSSEGIPRFKRIWLGVSIENRRYVGRADLLRDTPAAVRFISAEPLLGPLMHDCWRSRDGFVPDRTPHSTRVERAWSDDYDGPELDLTGIDWLIVGGESGPGHRPMDLRWARELRDACAETALREGRGPVLFLKQLGGARPDTPLEQIPEDLRVREFPRA